MARPPRTPEKAIKGRGATFNPGNRFAHHEREDYDDGWDDGWQPLAPDRLDPDAGEEPPPLTTTVTVQIIRSIISRNDSPDIGFTQSINPYQGCEHGCIYCYARPSHAYLDLSPGLDFESKLFAKPDAPEQLRRELMNPRYQPETIVIGTNTDCYQPIEREWKITRGLLEVFEEFKHPVGLITKSALVERDIDILARLAKNNLARVYVSITTLDRELHRRMEPRAAAPQRRLEMVKTLADAGIPVGVMTAPIIPMLNDRDMETILQAAHDAGARFAGYTMVRLSYELREMFKAWLAEHYPQRAEHVMSIIRRMRGGKENDTRFGARQRGTGEFAELIARRFALACKRFEFNREQVSMEMRLFRRPDTSGQMTLF